MRTQTYRFGTSGWRYDDWKGPFLPLNGDDLASYAQRFDTVEIDSTWYHSPAPRVVASWAARVPDGFRFSAKIPRQLTHDQHLVGCKDALLEFLRAMQHLNDRRGPLLFQFPPQWTALEGTHALQKFLPLLPREWQFAMEFRHRSWFSSATASMLEDAAVAWALADFGHWWSARPQPPMFVTADFTYIRWMGDRHALLEPYNQIHIDRSVEEERWAQAIPELPVIEVWGYFNNHWAGFSPASAQGFLQRLGLPRPETLTPPHAASPDQPSLF